MTGPVWNPMAQQYEPKPRPTLADFLLQRIAEDEAAANACIGRHWHSQARAELRTIPQDDPRGAVKPYWHQIAVSGYDGGPDSVKEDYDERPSFAHIARWAPARVLAECQAKRLIVELHQDGMADDRWEGDPDPLPGYCTRCHNRSEHQQEAWPCLTLRLLALPYRDHRDYDEAWKP